MPDYDWFSKQSIKVAVEGIHDEAKKWHELSGRMAGVKNSAAALTLQPSAFAVIDFSTGVTQADLHDAYTKMQTLLVSLFAEGSVEFDRFSDALDKCAKAYRHADEHSAQNFDDIAKGK